MIGKIEKKAESKTYKYEFGNSVIWQIWPNSKIKVKKGLFRKF